jgi:hypothetical protein
MYVIGAPDALAGSAISHTRSPLALSKAASLASLLVS